MRQTLRLFCGATNPADLCTTKATRFGRSVLPLRVYPGRELAVILDCVHGGPLCAATSVDCRCRADLKKTQLSNLKIRHMTRKGQKDETLPGVCPFFEM